MSQKKTKILFSDHFSVTKKTLTDYGAFNISLLTDLPLFIDPFLLFNSKNKQYQKLHDEMIAYLRFLKDKSAATHVDDGLLVAWYRFPEVKQNWFGFSVRGNGGRGLGGDFAKALNTNLYSVFSNFGEEKVTKGSHLERLCLIAEGIGKDNISDFTTNLIKGYLLEYTQSFAKKYLKESQCSTFSIEKVRFNYKTESWETQTFYLPKHNDDFVLLTPRDILTKDDTWINKTDIIENFHDIRGAISNESLRSQLNNYFLKALPRKKKNKEPTPKEKRVAIAQTVAAHPEFIDYYIKYKEDRSDEARSISDERVEYSEDLYTERFEHLSQQLAKDTEFYSVSGDTLEEVRQRTQYFKDTIEKNDGYTLLYDKNGQPIKTEKDLQILYRFVWFGTQSDVNREPNNGRGPVDYAVSRGAKDKSLAEFKLAKNTHLKKNLQKQLAIYKDANNTDKGLYVIFFFSAEERSRVIGILEEVGLDDSEYVVLVDARKDNKESASKAKAIN